MAAFVPRALIFGDPEKAVYFRLLKDFLFKLGLRDTQGISDPSDITRSVFDNVWPIVFIDHSDGLSDGYAVFEGLYKTPGFELIPFLFLSPGDKVIYQLFGVSAGARGVLQKPLQPQDAARLLRGLVPPNGDPATTLALQISRLLLKGDMGKAMPALAKLAVVPYFRRQAEIALARCEMRLGLMAQAQQRLGRLSAKDDKDVRVLCELADFHRKNSQLASALLSYKKVHALHPQLRIKIWDQILLHVELDQLDEAALLLDDLQADATFRDLSTEGLARLMNFMGLTQSVANVLKPQPELLKSYFNWLNVYATNRG